MFVYNITFAVARRIEADFIKQLRSDFIPAALEGGDLSNPRLARVMHSPDPDTATYALQFEAPTIDDINFWYEDAGSRLFSSLLESRATDAAFFTTTLEILD